MFNLPEIQVSSFVNRSHLNWWSREAEWLTTRLDKWLSSYRGYTKLRTSRISRVCHTMVQESDDGATSSDDSLKNSNAQNPRHSKRSYSQPSSPGQHDRTVVSSQTTENMKTSEEQCANTRRITSADEVELVVADSKDDVKMLEEEYRRQFRQPYGWTDYNKDDVMDKQNNNKNSEPAVKKKESRVHITRHNSNKCFNCCYEFCLEEKTNPVNCVTYENDRRKKISSLEVITNKISQANSSCDKYFSVKRRHQVHTTQEDGFFTYRRRTWNYKKSSRTRHKRRVVFGGEADNDPMWPAVLLTFDRGVTANHTIPHTSLPETVL